jgi:hypothetical protein
MQLIDKSDHIVIEPAGMVPLNGLLKDAVLFLYLIGVVWSVGMDIEKFSECSHDGGLY